jgi:superfamily I DNA and/or RNA helicase
LIAPYKTQAVLLSKLITSYGISKNIRVISDTVHGFQGDECDIVFFVCNPNNPTASNQIYKKVNIR